MKIVIKNVEWTEEKIKKLLLTNDAAVERALIRLFQKQTAYEQQAERTKMLNGVGFTGLDAKFYTSLTKRVINGYHLTPGQLKALRKPDRRGNAMICKYAGQILKIMAEDANVA